MINCPYSEKDKAKQLPRAKWHKKLKRWGIPKIYEAVDAALRAWPDEELAVEDDLEEWFHKEGEHREAVWDARHGDLFHSWPDKLRPYQKVGAEFLTMAGRAILADEMGLGKTVQALRAAVQLDDENLLVICPNILKTHWRKEVEKWTDYEPAVVRGGPELRANVIQEDGDVTIVNEALVRPGNDLDVLKEQDYDLVIADEAHHFKNRDAQQTEGFHKLANNAQHLFELTGTPIQNRVEELWSLLHAVDPDRYSSFWRFVKKHADAHPGRFGWEIADHPTDPEALQKELQPYLLRRTNDELKDELPEKNTRKYWVNLTGEQQRLYDEMEENFVAEVQDGEYVSAPAVLSQITRLKQIAIAPALIGGGGPSAKLKALRGIINRDESEQFVVFSQFKKPLAMAAQLVDGATALLTGDVAEEERANLVDDFERGRLQVLCATIAVAGHGLDLTAASNVIFLDKHWTPANNEQAVARVYRSGQDEQVQVTELLASGTIEEYIEMLLDDKVNIAESILDHIGRWAQGEGKGAG